MLLSFLPTVVIAAIGMSAARIGDRLRAPLLGCKALGQPHVWSYQGERQPRGLQAVPGARPCA